MLLVDHTERELLNSHALLYQRMRSEHRADFPAREPPQDLDARRTSHAPRQQRMPYP